MEQARELYRKRINGLEKGLKNWFNEIDNHVNDAFINVINGVFDECDSIFDVDSRLYNLRNEFWHNSHYWNKHIDEYLSKATFFLLDSNEIDEELRSICESRHFKKKNIKELLANSVIPLKVEAIVILQKESSLTEEQFFKKIDDISEIKMTMGHYDNWDENGRHSITPVLWKYKVLKRMNKKIPRG